MNIQLLLLVGQVLVVVLVYLFVWRVMRTASRDVLDAAPAGGAGRGGVAAGQESTIIPAADVARARREAGLAEPRIVVRSSARLRPGVPYVIGTGGLTVGRAADNDIVLDDPVVSGHHARLLPPGIVTDLGSTNGTFVDGSPVSGRAQLRHGNELVIGDTTFRFEDGRR